MKVGNKTNTFFPIFYYFFMLRLDFIEKMFIFVPYNIKTEVSDMVKREKKTVDVDAKLADFYKLLTPEEQETVKNNMTILNCKRNEVLYREGDRPDRMFILLTGKAKLFREGVGRRNQTMRLLKPIEYFGYRAYVSDQDFVTSAAVMEPSIVASVPLEVLIPIMKSNAKLSWYFVVKLAAALGQADERAVNLTQKHIRARLADTLLFLRDTYGLEEDGCTLSIYLSREDIANLSNMTTANAIRLLSAFAQEKLVAIDGRKIKLMAPEELATISKLG